MHRWTAAFLALVMLASAFGPVGTAHAATPDGMHCMRRPLAATRAAAPAMHCHESAQAPAPEPEQQSATSASEASVSSLDCCANHECCRGLKTSDWARPASNPFSSVQLKIHPTVFAQTASRVSDVFAGPDSARAPPRS
jgi:hypothetical protein